MAFARKIKYNLTTEVRDFVTALWKNIPEECKKYRMKGRLKSSQNKRRRNFDKHHPVTSKVQPKQRGSPYPSLTRMMEDVYNHADCIKWEPWEEMRTNLRKNHTRVIQHNGAIIDLGINEANDRFFGKLGVAAKNATLRLGYTAGIQFGGGLTNRRFNQEMGTPGPVNYIAEMLGF